MAGSVRLGGAWYGELWQGMSGKVRCGALRYGLAGLGSAGKVKEENTMALTEIKKNKMGEITVKIKTEGFDELKAYLKEIEETVDRVDNKIEELEIKAKSLNDKLLKD